MTETHAEKAQRLVEMLDDLAYAFSEALDVIEAYVAFHPILDSGNQVLERYLRDPARAERFRARVVTRHQEEVGDDRNPR